MKRWEHALTLDQMRGGSAPQTSLKHLPTALIGREEGGDGDRILRRSRPTCCVPALGAAEVGKAIPFEMLRPAMEAKPGAGIVRVDDAGVIASPVAAGQVDVHPPAPEVREAVESLGAHPPRLERSGNIGQASAGADGAAP